MRQSDGLSAGPDVELPEEVPDMKFHSIFADIEFSGDGPVTLAGRQQLQDFQLPRRKAPRSFMS